MTLQFNPGAYESAYQTGQQNAQANRDRDQQALIGGISGIANGYQSYLQRQMQLAEKQKQDKYNQLLMDLKLRDSNRQDLQSQSDYGTPIDPNLMTGQPTGQTGYSSFMPGGSGPVASGSPLIESFRKWQAGGMQARGAQPEYMGALAKDERKQFYDQFDPKNMADIDLKKAQAEYYRNKPTETPESYSIGGTDRQGNIIQVGNRSGNIRSVPVPGGTIYPKNPSLDQSNAGIYGQRAAEADQQLGQLIQGGFNPNDTMNAVQGSKYVPNIFKSGQVQSLEQSKRNFMTAVLRRESGATIRDEEMAEGNKQYFPVYGDGPDVLAQKAQNRKTVINGLYKIAGPMAQAPTSTQPAGNKAQTVVQNGHTYTLNPQTGQYE